MPLLHHARAKAAIQRLPDRPTFADITAAAAGLRGLGEAEIDTLLEAEAPGLNWESRLTLKLAAEQTSTPSTKRLPDYLKDAGFEAGRRYKYAEASKKLATYYGNAPESVHQRIGALVDLESRGMIDFDMEGK